MKNPFNLPWVKECKKCAECLTKKQYPRHAIMCKV